MHTQPDCLHSQTANKTPRSFLSTLLLTAMSAFIGAFIAIPVAAQEESDFQAWQTASLKWFDSKYVNLITTAHFRFTNDSSEFSLWRIGQAVITEPLPWLRAGVAYRYTESKNSLGDWQFQHRNDLQLTPHWKLDKWGSMSLRNRLELRWNQNTSEMNIRSRHRMQVNISTPQWRPLQAIYINNEVFHDFDLGKISENRVVPLGLRLQWNDKTNYRLFYMLRSARSTHQWRHDHIVGIGLIYIP
jgi:hypothetical protein